MCRRGFTLRFSIQLAIRSHWVFFPFTEKYGKNKTKDVEELLSLLENSDVEGLSDENDDDHELQLQNQNETTIDAASSSDGASDTEDTPLVEVPVTAGTSGEIKQRAGSASTITRPTTIGKSSFSWKEKAFVSKEVQFSRQEVTSEVKTPLEYFSRYFSESHFEETTQYTNMYSLAKTGKELKTEVSEIKKLYGVHLVFGVIPYPRLHMYWKTNIKLDVVANAITRDRLFNLRTCLHYVDTQHPPEDHMSNRLWKVQPIIDTVRDACRSIPREITNYSIDEQMIPFTGRCLLKQYVKGKPRPVGLKNFVVTTSKGLVVDFEIYQGKTTPLPETQYGLGPAVVLRLASTLPEGSSLYFDRYFTTVPLIQKLSEKNLFGTGTIMNNRIKASFVADNKLKRGESQELCCQNDELVAVKWRDSKCVTLLSNISGKFPEKKVKRWCKQEKKEIEVPCPNIVVNYNRNMGGVDICDQQMECYRTWIKTRKWTLKVSLHFLDLAVVNSWMEYRADCVRSNVPKNKVKDLLCFRMEIAEALISAPKRNRRSFEEEDTEINQQQKKPQNYRAPLPGVDKKLDGYDHWPINDDLTTARMCRIKECLSRTRIRCEKCNVYLCLNKNKNCFKDFHTPK